MYWKKADADSQHRKFSHIYSLRLLRLSPIPHSISPSLHLNHSQSITIDACTTHYYHNDFLCAALLLSFHRQFVYVVEFVSSRVVSIACL